MCQRAQCTMCIKPTFRGCGRHVEQVLGDVPEADRCHCREAKAEQPRTEKKPILDRIFGR